nr:MAG TPA: hypothetical protein [Caudoviricetes sp.]
MSGHDGARFGRRGKAWLGKVRRGMAWQGWHG